jgi:phosphoribosylamine--glycine ligase
MKILFVSNDLLAGNIAHLLVKDGHKVKLHIGEVTARANLHGMVDKVEDWRAELTWVGKDGLIVFDDIGDGETQDKLRKEGYTVFGNCADGDLLEQDRVFGQERFAEAGMKIVPIHNFSDAEKAIQFVKKHRYPWVIKQNSLSDKGLNYVGLLDDGQDVIDVLSNYSKNESSGNALLTLQKRIDGVEIAVTRIFNGTDWIGPSLINIEHKKFLAGDIGPTTSEMGTLGWYEKDDNNKLFKETLGKLKPYLQKIGYRGIIDINCIVNGDGAFPLEATCRAGSPIIHMQTELNLSPWFELLLATAQGKPYNLKYKKGFGIVVVVAIPPYPFAKKIREHSQIGTCIYFDETMSEKENTHIHYEEVSWDAKRACHYISDRRGYVLYVTETGKSVEEAQKKAYKIINKIRIPKMMYRNDIGQRFIETSKGRLKTWGYSK